MAMKDFGSDCLVAIGKGFVYPQIVVGDVLGVIVAGP
jgi:hypothetical protein